MTVSARLRWCAVFLAIFTLAMDYWWWDGPVRLGFLRMPAWVYYFAGLQVLLSVALHVFARAHWREPDAEREDGDPP